MVVTNTMKSNPSSSSSLFSSSHCVLFAVVFTFLSILIAAHIHGQPVPVSVTDQGAAVAAATSTTSTLSSSATTTIRVVEAVAPSLTPIISAITAIVVALVGLARVIWKYIPAVRGTWFGSLVNHAGLIVTCLCVGFFVTACSTAQVTQFKADANKAATDVLLAAPKALAYTASASADVLIAVKDITPLAAEVQAATATTSSVSK